MNELDHLEAIRRSYYEDSHALDGEPRCANCGGEYADHIPYGDDLLCLDRDNVGQLYEPWTDQDEGDAAYDAATERWERSRE